MKKCSLLTQTISTLLAGVFLCGQVYAGDNDKLAASSALDSDINPSRSEIIQIDIAEKLEPGAIGNGEPLLELAKGKLPAKIELEKTLKTLYDEYEENIRGAIFNALYHMNRAMTNNNIPRRYLKQLAQAGDNLNKLSNFFSTQAYLFKADIRGPEDYLLGFSFDGKFGYSVELIDRLYRISPKRLAQYIFHECVPEEGPIIERSGHRAIYNELQSVIFGEDEVAALKKDLRQFVDEKAAQITVSDQAKPGILKAGEGISDTKDWLKDEWDNFKLLLDNGKHTTASGVKLAELLDGVNYEGQDKIRVELGLAEALYQGERYDLAIAHFKNLLPTLEKMPEFETTLQDIYLKLGHAYYKTEDYLRALAILEDNARFQKLSVARKMWCFKMLIATYFASDDVGNAVSCAIDAIELVFEENNRLLIMQDKEGIQSLAAVHYFVGGLLKDDPDDEVRKVAKMQLEYAAYLTLHQSTPQNVKFGKFLSKEIDAMNNFSTPFGWLSEDDLSASLFSTLGWDFIEKEQYNSAIKILKMGTERFPRDGKFYSAIVARLGVAYYRKGNLASAIEQYREAIELGCYEFGVFNNLGRALFDNKQYEEALPILRRASAIAPDNESRDNIDDSLQQIEAILNGQNSGVRTKQDSNEIGKNLPPGAVGNGAPLVELSYGRLPPRHVFQKPEEFDKVARMLRPAIDRALELSNSRLKAVPYEHKNKFEQIQNNLIEMRTNLSKKVYIFDSDVRASEDYLLGFNSEGVVGLSLELIYMLHSFSTERLAQYIFHECAPEEGPVTERMNHKAIYNEIQPVIFGKNEVLELKRNFRDFIDRKTSKITPANPAKLDMSAGDESDKDASAGWENELWQHFKRLLKEKKHTIQEGIELAELLYRADYKGEDELKVKLGIAEALYEGKHYDLAIPHLENVLEELEKRPVPEIPLPALYIKLGYAHYMGRDYLQAIDIFSEVFPGLKGVSIEQKVYTLGLLSEICSKYVGKEGALCAVIDALNATLEGDNLSLLMRGREGPSLLAKTHYLVGKLLKNQPDKGMRQVAAIQFGYAAKLFEIAQDHEMAQRSWDGADGAILSDESFVSYEETFGDNVLLGLFTALGRKLIRAGLYDEAIETLQIGAETVPSHTEDYAEIVALLGETYQRKGDPDKAIEQYQKAIALGGVEFGVFNNLGGILFDKERYEEAMPILYRASKLIRNAEEKKHVDGLIEKAKKALDAKKETMRTKSESDGIEKWLPPGTKFFITPMGRFKPKRSLSASSAAKIQAALMAKISDALPARAQIFKANLIRILAAHPKKLFYIGIETDIGESQKAHIMPLYNAIDDIKELKDSDGNPLFPNLMVERAKARKLVNNVSGLIKEGKLNPNDIFIGARKLSVDNNLYESISGEGNAWIASIDDSSPEAYLPVFEAITLNMMAYLNADTSAIKSFYDAISDSPVDPRDLKDMIKNRIIYILPKATKFDTKQLRKLYELAQQVYMAA